MNSKIDFGTILAGLGLTYKIDYLFFRATNKSLIFFDANNSAFHSEKEPEQEELPIGSLVIEVANIKHQYSGNYDGLIYEVCSVQNTYRTLNDAFAKALYTTMQKHFSNTLSKILVIMCCNSITNAHSVKPFLIDTLIPLSEKTCNGYVDGSICGMTEIIDFKTVLKPDKAGTNAVLWHATKERAENIVLFDLYKAVEQQIKPKRCKLCGKAFLPASRSDEIYCRNEYKNGRTCADIGFELTSKENPFYAEYRKAYKTLKARAARADGNTRLQKKIKQWTIDAKAKQIEYEASGDIDGYKEWIQSHKDI